VCEDCSDLVAVRQREDVGEVDQKSVDEDKVQSFLCKHCRWENSQRDILEISCS